jgi:hypothetical protein
VSKVTAKIKTGSKPTPSENFIKINGTKKQLEIPNNKLVE